MDQGDFVYGAADFGVQGHGLRSGRKGFGVRPWQWLEALNAELHGQTLVKRRGTKQVGTVVSGMAAAVRYVQRFYYGAANGLLASANGKMWYRTVGDWTDAAVGTWSAGAFPVGVGFANSEIIANGVQQPVMLTWAAAPVASTMSTYSSYTPAWVAGPMYGRIFYPSSVAGEGDRIYFTDVGAPNTTKATSWLRVPEDRMGEVPRIGVLGPGNMIAVFCDDCVVGVTGATPISFRTEKFPKGAGLCGWRTVVNAGNYWTLMTTRGLAMWGGRGPVELLDPDGEVDWSDCDMSTPELMHSVRYFDQIWLFYRSKGLSSPLTAATVSPSRWMVSVNLATAITGRAVRAVGYSSAPTTSHYLTYDMHTGAFGGPHTGAWMSACWQQLRNGHYQDLVLGAAAATGVVAVGDQADRFVDCLGSVTGGVAADSSYDVNIRFGAAVADPFEEHVVKSVTLMMGGRRAGGGVTARLLFSGDDEIEGSSVDLVMDPQGPVDVSQDSRVGPRVGLQRGPVAGMGKGGVWRRWVPDQRKGFVAGFAPMLELTERSKAGWWLGGFKMVTALAAERGGR